ncbi:hypothetical protein SDC9_80850 [bioreactor metagenome]|uniref:Uncharacterized protein n=1 Tax=bioreactor metagenome TaxID=1076179 RepID=A0A644Z1U3_9ZZZZ
MVSAMPAFTATAPPPAEAAAAMAFVLPVVVTEMVLVTPVRFALPPMAETTFAWKYVTAPDTLTATAPPVMASVPVSTWP